MFKDALSLLTEKEQRRVRLYAWRVVFSGLCEALSVLTVLPFLMRVSQPGASATVLENFLTETFHLKTPEQTLIYTGLFSIFAIISANLFAARTVRRGCLMHSELESSLIGRFFDKFYSQPYENTLTEDPVLMKRNLLHDSTELVADSVMGPLIGASKAIGALLALVALSIVKPWETLLVAGALAGVYTLVFRYLLQHNARLSAKRRQLIARRDQFVEDIVAGLREVKLHRLGPKLSKLLTETTEETSLVHAQHQTLTQTPKYVIESLGHTVLFSAVLFQVYLGRSPLEMFPFIGAAALISYRLIPSIQALYGLILTQRFKGPAMSQAIERLHQVDAPRQNSPQPPLTEVRLKSVRFSYPQSTKNALEDISLTVKAGEKIGLIGKNGAGKSTLLSVLLGLLPPQRGEIFFNGMKISAQNAESWWDQIAYIPQNIFLLEGTVAENIALWKSNQEIDREKMIGCAKQCLAHDFIESLEHGYDTQIGRNGIKLSGGQKQRLALCRALYQNPKMLLLDEATNAIDPQTEQTLCKWLCELPMMVVMVSHRASNLTHCDRIYRLEKGSLELSEPQASPTISWNESTTLSLT